MATGPQTSHSAGSLSVGAVLDEAWTLYLRFFARFVILGLVVFLIVNLATALLDAAVDRDSSGGILLVRAVSVGLGLVGMYWLQGALVYAVQDVRDGRFDASTSEVFAQVAPYVPTLAVVGFLAGLGIALGLILLIVPGLVLLTYWAVVAPVVVLEGKGVLDSFGRSRELVRGHGWTVFGIVIVTAVLSQIGSGILQLVLSFLPRFLEIWIGGSIAYAVVLPFSALALIVTYFRLRGGHGDEPVDTMAV